MQSLMQRVQALSSSSFSSVALRGVADWPLRVRSASGYWTITATDPPTTQHALALVAFKENYHGQEQCN